MLHIPRKRKADMRPASEHDPDNARHSDGNETEEEGDDDEGSHAQPSQRKRPMWGENMGIFADPGPAFQIQSPPSPSNSRLSEEEPSMSVQQRALVLDEAEVEDNPVSNFRQAPLASLRWIDECEEADQLLDYEDAVSEPGYCYLCYQKLPADHPFILIIQKELSDQDVISVKTLCHMIQGLYNSYIGPLLAQKRNYLLRDIYNHISKHIVDPRAIMVNELRVLKEYREEYTMRALTIDPDNPTERLPMDHRHTQMAVNLSRAIASHANALNTFNRQQQRGRM